jgi:Rrf2 family protein
MLTLTKKVDYGLIALAHLAGEPGRVASAAELSRRFKLPQYLLANIMKELTAAKMVESIRGVHGGYRLARDPEQITLADMIRALEHEAQASLAECVAADGTPMDENCKVSQTCPVKSPMRKVNNRLQALLNEVTLAELTRNDEPPARTPAIPLPMKPARTAEDRRDRS